MGDPSKKDSSFLWYMRVTRFVRKYSCGLRVIQGCKVKGLELGVGCSLVVAVFFGSFCRAPPATTATARLSIPAIILDGSVSLC